MTIVPRTSEGSAISAPLTTAWYQAGKSSDCLGSATARESTSSLLPFGASFGASFGAGGLPASTAALSPGLRRRVPAPPGRQLGRGGPAGQRPGLADRTTQVDERRHLFSVPQPEEVPHLVGPRGSPRSQVRRQPGRVGCEQ